MYFKQKEKSLKLTADSILDQNVLEQIADIIKFGRDVELREALEKLNNKQ